MSKKVVESKIDLTDFHIEQVENGWKIKASDIRFVKGWWSEEEITGWPKTYVFDSKAAMISWIEKHV